MCLCVVELNYVPGSCLDPGEPKKWLHKVETNRIYKRKLLCNFHLSNVRKNLININFSSLDVQQPQPTKAQGSVPHSWSKSTMLDSVMSSKWPKWLHWCGGSLRSNLWHKQGSIKLWRVLNSRLQNHSESTHFKPCTFLDPSPHSSPQRTTHTHGATFDRTKNSLSWRDHKQSTNDFPCAEHVEPYWFWNYWP